jgi:hypothetical protein
MVQTDPSDRTATTCDLGSGGDGDELDYFRDKLPMVGWGENPFTRRISKAGHRFIDGRLLAHLPSLSLCLRSRVEQECIESMFASANTLLLLNSFSSFFIYNCRSSKRAGQVQEVMRLLLDAYLEPQFSPHSHGFRPQRGCHTALREIYHNWVVLAHFW